MHFERRFTTSGQDAYANIEFRSATSEIRNPDGTIVFQAENITVPAQFSQVATDILAQKYFRQNSADLQEALQARPNQPRCATAMMGLMFPQSALALQEHRLCENISAPECQLLPVKIELVLQYFQPETRLCHLGYESRLSLT